MIAQTPNIINKRILQIAVPSIISNITVPLLGLIDVTIVGASGSRCIYRSHCRGRNVIQHYLLDLRIFENGDQWNDLTGIRQT